MKVIILVCLLVVSSPAFAACGPDTAPAYAQAYGLTCETFHDGPFSTTTIDVSNTATFANPVGSCSSGACNWYTDPNFPNLIAGAGCPGGPFPCPVTTPAQYSISGSTGDITLQRTSAYTAGRVDLATCKGNGMSAGQHIGYTFQAPFYIEALFTAIGAGLDSATAEATMWLLPVNYLVNGVGAGSDGVEIDMIEGNGPTKTQHDFTVDNSGNQIEWFQVYSAVPPVNHSSGLVVVLQNQNPNNTNYTTGLSLIYDNGSLVASNAITFGTASVAQYNGGNYGLNGSNPPGHGPPDSRVGALASHQTNQYCILMGSGFNIPLGVRYVRVWQLPPNPPIGLGRRVFGDNQAPDDMPRFADKGK